MTLGHVASKVVGAVNQHDDQILLGIKYKEKWIMEFKGWFVFLYQAQRYSLVVKAILRKGSFKKEKWNEDEMEHLGQPSLWKWKVKNWKWKGE